MKFKITYLKKATKFLAKNTTQLSEKEVDELVIKFLKRHLLKQDINIDYRPLKGKLDNFFRIRKANIRIIIQLKDKELIIEAIVENIDYRGGVYK